MGPDLRRHPAATIALTLAVLGLLWIAGSDWLVHRLLPPRLWPEAQTVKGTVFVLLGAGIAYAVVRSFRRDVDGLVERLQRAEAIAGIGGWQIDLDSGDLEWTRQVHRIVGEPPEGVAPTWADFMERVHPDDRGEVESARATAVEGDGTLDVEHRIVRRDGEVRWVRERGEVVEDGEGRRLVGTVEDVTDRHQTEEALRHQALHDTLTDLPNRTLFQDRLETAFARAERTGSPLGLVVLDLVRFKDVNDSLGRRAGDQVLQEVAHRLELCLRESDTVARVGGDEFALVLEEVEDDEGAEQALARIDDAFEDPFGVRDEQVWIEIRAGVAVFSPERGRGAVRAEHPQELVRAADLAMHRAKEKGSHHVFSPGEDVESGSRFRRLQRLRRGIESGEFEPFYQPVVDLGSGEVWGVEPLARWHHPERGLVSPAEFIPLAEESGLIAPLGELILRQACTEVAAWNRDGIADSPLRVSPNLSARQLDEGDVVGMVEEVLGETEFPPELCQFEVTETAILRAGAGVDVLRDRGVRVAIDDFGTGYASFTYLRDLSIDALKIDMSFVRDMVENEGDRAICRTVVGLAEAFGLSVIAEGIETEAQRSELKRLGCPLGQGFLFARPRPASEMRGMLSNGGLRPTA